MSPRYAIYYTPPPFSALARFGAGVIGYDCFDAVEVAHARLDGIDSNIQKLMTLDPRQYGFDAGSRFRVLRRCRLRGWRGTLGPT
jgi:hypothetical protein